MIPKFSEYFYPFLLFLSQKKVGKVSDIMDFIGEYFCMSVREMHEKTKSGRITKHKSRCYYCATYLKTMGFIQNLSHGNYKITETGLSIFNKYGRKLTLRNILESSEFKTSKMVGTRVYVKPHVTKNGKAIAGYYADPKSLKDGNPNVDVNCTKDILA